MHMKRLDDSPRSDRLAPQTDARFAAPEGPRSGWPNPPIGSDLAADADQLQAVTQPVRPALPPPNYLYVKH